MNAPPFMACSLDSLNNESNTAENLSSIFKSASLNERCLSSSTSGYNTSCSIESFYKFTLFLQSLYLEPSSR